MSETFFAIVPSLAGTAQAGISLRSPRPEQPAPQPPNQNCLRQVRRIPTCRTPSLRDLKFRTLLPVFRTRQS